MPILDDFTQQFQDLRVNRQGDHFSPHKPTMLLAVFALANAGRLTENRIPFSPALLERYRQFFSAVKTETDHPNPYFPFFHLRKEPFWQLVARPGRDAVLDAMSTARSMSDIENNIEYATLDPDLHRLLQDQRSVSQLRATLVVRWFGDRSRELDTRFEYEQRIGQQESILRDSPTASDCPPADPDDRPARDAAFRRIVSEAYDYRCAATGWRIILPDGTPVILPHDSEYCPKKESLQWRMEKLLQP